MKKVIVISSKLQWEATRSCGMFMAMNCYGVNVFFPSEFWTYELLTEKFMKDIMRHNEAMKNISNYYVKEKKK